MEDLIFSLSWNTASSCIVRHGSCASANDSLCRQEIDMPAGSVDCTVSAFQLHQHFQGEILSVCLAEPDHRFSKFKLLA